MGLTRYKTTVFFTFLSYIYTNVFVIKTLKIENVKNVATNKKC